MVYPDYSGGVGRAVWRDGNYGAKGGNSRVTSSNQRPAQGTDYYIVSNESIAFHCLMRLSIYLRHFFNRSLNVRLRASIAFEKPTISLHSSLNILFIYLHFYCGQWYCFEIATPQEVIQDG